MYNNVAVYSEVDPLAPDLDRHPLFEEANQIHFDIGPGQTLFIPAGWWHHVEALESSISVSFTNFAFSNAIDWANPTLSL
jgi:ribosomal protein L16 Arg81 hydroxylase